MSIELIRSCSKNLKFSNHAKEEMMSEEFGIIWEHETREAIEDGEIIEEYPRDRPYPSFLVFGKTKLDRPLHVVCAPVGVEQILVIITVYQPNPSQWTDYRRRKL